MSQRTDGFAGSDEPPQPGQARTPAEFTEALRALRIWSGLTYRQLEGKATAHADALPTSTIASTLGRTTLPRARFVEAFTRACGLDDEHVRTWLEARHRIAAYEAAPGGDESGDPPGAPPTEEPGAARAPRWHRVAGLVGAVGIGIAGTLGVGALLDDPSARTALPEMPVTGLRMLAVGSWADIHPVGTPELCVTEGRDRTGRYETAVAAQQPCSKAGLPQVFLEPLSKDTVQIQWYHPQFGIGCLTVMTQGAGRDLLEPRDHCDDDNEAQQFRIERFGPPALSRFRILPVATGQCLSLREQDTETGTEVVQGPCSGASDQDFLIELLPPPQTVADPARSSR